MSNLAICKPFGLFLARNSVIIERLRSKSLDLIASPFGVMPNMSVDLIDAQA